MFNMQIPLFLTSLLIEEGNFTKDFSEDVAGLLLFSNFMWLVYWNAYWTDKTGLSKPFFL